MFGFKLVKKQKNRHRFNDVDRALADELKHFKTLRQIEKIRALRGEAAEGKPQKTLTEQLREISSAKAEMEALGLINRESGDMDKEMLSLVMQFLATKNQQPLPQENVTTHHKQRQNGQKVDQIDELIERIPPKLQEGIKKGLITESMAVNFGKKQGEKMARAAYKRIRSKGKVLSGTKTK